MYLLYMLKIIADIAFYYTFANFAAVGINHLAPKPADLVSGATNAAPDNLALFSLFIFAACALASVALYDKCKNKGLRFLPLLLLPVNFLLMPMGLYGIFLVAVPTLYAVYSVTALRSFTGHFYYNVVFMQFAKAFFPFAVLFMLIPSLRGDFIAHSLPFALLFFTASVILMRMARHNPQVHTQWQFRLMNLLSLGFLFIIGAVAGSRQLMELARGVISILLRELYTGFLFMADKIIFWLQRFLAWLFPNFVPWEAVQDEAPETVEEDLFGLLEEIPSDSPMTFFLILLGIIAVLFLIWLFKRLATVQLPKIAESGVYESHTPIDAKVRSDRMRNPLRRVYRRFLRLCFKRGIHERSYFTSREYERRATDRFSLGDEAKRLRALYLPVRYGSKPPNREDVSAAKELYRQIRSKSKK